MGIKGKRGFGNMPKDKQKQIASWGGQVAHAQGKAHEFTPEEAREAGKRGGDSLARDRAHMAEIGRRGGLARAKKKLEREVAERST
jgi:general stress protein YciG